MWRVAAVAAVWWPSRVSGVFDGAPLDTVAEALILGLALPVLAWLHPRFFQRTLARVMVCAIVALKIGAAFSIQQQGWCLTFDPPKPMVRDSTGKPHAWDVRADWLSDDPACSAVMTRPYQDTRELPVWFYNLAPPDDAPHRGGYGFGEIAVRQSLAGFLSAADEGVFELVTGTATTASLFVDGRPVEAARAGHHVVPLARGTHHVRVEATLLGKDWPLVPHWNGAAIGSMRFPLATIEAPSRLDRLAHPYLNWLLVTLCAVLIAWWVASVIASLRDAALVIWSVAASAAVAIAVLRVPEQAAWYTAAVLAVSTLMMFRARHHNLRGAFLAVALPWLAFVGAANAHQIGRWTLYGVGNDDFQFQRFAYRVFMQRYWLEGGQVTFWNQPLIRWIVGAQHLLFGDSSVGQAYWDAFGVAAMALFAYWIVRSVAGFTAGVAAAVMALAMFLLGPTLPFVGFGLSEISSAALIYAAAFFAIRNREWRDVGVMGLLLTLAFYTRLNNLPMALAVAAFALPVAMPASALWRPRLWWPLVRWRVVIGVTGSLALGAVLFAWRTWHYTGVFSVFHGTQREHLAVWKPHMTMAEGVSAMISSLLMVVTVSDPPALAWHAAPVMAAAIIAVLAVLNVPGFRQAPLPIVLLFLAGCSGALATRGWAYAGRFSIHLFGVAAVLCVWGLSAAARGLRRRAVWYAPERTSQRAAT